MKVYSILIIKFTSLEKKYVEFCTLWDLSLGFCDEIYDMLRKKYSNQRGVKIVEDMMRKMYLIASPKYSDKYTMENDDN